MPLSITPHDPTEGIYPTGPAWVHANEVAGAERFLFVAGTLGLDPAGVAGATLDDQLALLWGNIATILRSAGMTVDNIVRLTSYLTDIDQAPANTAARLAALGGRAIPTTGIVVQALFAKEFLVEIEVIAAA